jgi:hypothetical protein
MASPGAVASLLFIALRRSLRLIIILPKVQGEL